ncbi:MAG TPA: hypothetical protein ENK55_01770, partial [Actinobacteria bacterium]|nr:hypothetical protein [Actinomycetota bacterium]
MRSDDAASVLLGTGAFAAYGAFLAGGPGAIGLGVLGAALGYLAARLGVRPVVSGSVLVGAAVGALVGSAIARTLCLPGTCRAVEVAAGLAGGLGAFVGVGIVVALVVRSFDEYREAASRGAPPKITGCGPDCV